MAVSKSSRTLCLAAFLLIRFRLAPNIIKVRQERKWSQQLHIYASSLSSFWVTQVWQHAIIRLNQMYSKCSLAQPDHFESGLAMKDYSKSNLAWIMFSRRNFSHFTKFALLLWCVVQNKANECAILNCHCRRQHKSSLVGLVCKRNDYYITVTS